MNQLIAFAVMFLAGSIYEVITTGNWKALIVALAITLVFSPFLRRSV